MIGYQVNMVSKLFERFSTDLVREGRIDVRKDGTVWIMKAIKGSPRKLVDITPRKLTKKRNGYVVYSMVTPSGKRSVSAHRIVWQNLIGDIPPGLEINHKNGIKDDNRLENLELVTTRENILHAFRVIKTRTCKGSNHSQNKLIESSAMDVFRRRNGGESLLRLAREYGVSMATISNIAKKKSWKHIHI